MATETQHALTPGTLIGDYLVGELIAEGANTSTWSATQVSVNREVTLCALSDEAKNDPERREAFISDVRTKASVDHPLIASVLEAVNDETHCFFATEKLHGTSLAELHERGTSIPPLQIARIIRNISGACLYLDTQSIATLPLTPHDIFIDEQFHCRIVNLAVTGEPNPTTATHDKELVGQILHDLLEPNQPGSTRTGSLLDFMADTQREIPLSWRQIHDLSDQVERQLAEPKAPSQIHSPTMQMRPTKSNAALAKILSAAAVAILVVGLIFYFATRKTAPEERKLPDMVRIPAGKYPGPNGFPVATREFWIDAHEVTIGEYAKFLDALDILARDETNKNVYQHENQPPGKTNHIPDDWENLYTAAREGETWNGLQVDLNYPIVGIDWWDAYAYAEWKGCRLPTREEWYAACSSGCQPEKLVGTGWKPVDQTEKTSHGIYGMAGNVSEWMRKPTSDLANPGQKPRYIISGASYLRPKYGARAREWVKDRNVRRPDLGFRTLSTSPQGD